jgi:microcin C transport system ATP-binding protein
MSILTVDNLTITTGHAPLVKGVSFEIAQSEILALVGESGSGKTLTALSLMGLLPSALGVTGGITPNYRIGRGKEVGMIFQEPMTSLNPLHKIGKQVAESVRIHNRFMSKPAIRARVLELLGQVGLAHFKDRLDAYPHQLSGGERQRVMIAMAIANGPNLLIADEPTTALDVTIQAQILALLKDLQKTLGMAILLITHDLTIVRKVADRVAIMSQGEIVETGRTADIFAHPKNEYTKRLLAAEPKSLPHTVVAAPALMEGKSITVTFPVASHKLFAWKTEVKTVLNHVDVSVAQGSTLGIVGESGSGKTTLALALLRLAQSSGDIVFDGVHLPKLSPQALRMKRADMQIVFQDPFASLNPRMMVGQIIREGLDIHQPNLSKAQKEAQVDAILQETGLSPESKFRYPHEFSGGQRQRISIARALILKPKLIILDEPTSALDLSVQAQILDLLKDLQQKYGLTYIFISHDLRVVRSISHHIMVLKDGLVVETGEASAIFGAPKEDYTKRLLAAAFA